MNIAIDWQFVFNCMAFAALGLSSLIIYKGMYMLNGLDESLFKHMQQFSEYRSDNWTSLRWARTQCLEDRWKQKYGISREDALTAIRKIRESKKTPKTKLKELLELPYTVWLGPEYMYHNIENRLNAEPMHGEDDTVGHIGYVNNCGVAHLDPDDPELQGIRQERRFKVLAAFHLKHCK